MGLFSSKKKTIVGTSVSRLVKDEMLPDSVRTGMTRGIFQNADLPRSILDELGQGVALRAEKMYRYSENGYTFGSPSGDYVSSSRGTSQLLSVLASIEGGPVTLEYNHTGPPNILHIGWFKLVRDHGYDPVTNRLAALSVIKETDVFLDDLQVEIPTGSLPIYSGIPLQQWGAAARSGVSPTRPAVTAENGLGALIARSPVLEVVMPAGSDLARAKVAWVDPVTKLVVRDSFVIQNSEYDEAATYIQAKYLRNGQAKYWIYKLGTGTYPTLDALVSVPNSAGGQYFPFIHFRSQKASLGVNPASTAYKHSVKMAEKLGFDYVTLLDAIHENTQAADLEQAFLGLMVPANTDNEVERQYLFDFFDRMYEAGRSEDPVTTAAVEMAARGGGLDKPPIMGPYLELFNEFSEVIQDTNVKTTISNRGIQKLLVASPGVEGTHFSGRVLAPAGAQYTAYHFFRRQITPNIYQELRVLDLQTRYWVSGDYFTASDGDGENDILLVPVDRSITRDYGLGDRETLYARSMHVICNSLIVQTIKWYQQSWFGALLQILAVVIFVWSLGTSAEFSAFLAGTAATLATVVAVIQSIVINVLGNMLAALAFKLVAKELGADVALLLAVVAAIYAGKEAFDAGGFGNSLSAQRALDAATGLVKGVSATLMDAMKAIQLEMIAFQSESEDKLKLLEETQALLDSNQRMSPLILFGESPDDYYNRVVHAGNIGTIAYAGIHNFAEIALALPKISDTVEGF
jgi:hypothetical protein